MSARLSPAERDKFNREMDRKLEACGFRAAGGHILSMPRDSDGSPKGGDACGSVHDSAGPQDIAQTHSATRKGERE